jgi:hypothetical protein
MPNLLAGHVSLLAGTYALETLVKHYFDQFFGDKKAETSANGAKGLRKEELLYDEAFAIIKVRGRACSDYDGDVHVLAVLHGGFHIVSDFLAQKRAF